VNQGRAHADDRVEARYQGRGFIVVIDRVLPMVQARAGGGTKQFEVSGTVAVL
jgi:hypothetical protein